MASVRKVKPEKEIQKEILCWLSDSGIFHWRQNSGSLFLGNRMVQLGPAGLPDIIVILPPNGRFLGLEVKSAVGKLRPAQEEFKVKLGAAGGFYKVVRSLDQAMHSVAVAMGENLDVLS